MIRATPIDDMSRRGLALLIVLWAVVIASLVVVAIQATAFSQAAGGRESLARVRAFWAARAGVETMIARLDADTEDPDTSDAFGLYDRLADASEAELEGAAFRIVHGGPRGEQLGPEDAHAKLNINRLSRDQLLTIEPLMTEDVADSVLDWIDADDDTIGGAERSYYENLIYGYRPRNAPMRTIQELELVAGVDPIDVRGEDRNLNGVLDPGEDDGDASLPVDNRDGKLDAGWSGVLTTSSIEGGFTSSGESPLDLTNASESEVARRTSVRSDQAQAIVDYVAGSSNPTMRDFIRRDLAQLAQTVSSDGRRPAIDPLSDEQLASLLDQCVIGIVPAGLIPGKLNINTCEPETLQMLPNIDPAIADAIIAERSARPSGFQSIVDLKNVPGLGRNQLANLYDLLTVRSNVFVVTSRGRDNRTGVEVEIIATVDRSSLPAVIRSVRMP